MSSVRVMQCNFHYQKQAYYIAYIFTSSASKDKSRHISDEKKTYIRVFRDCSEMSNYVNKLKGCTEQQVINFILYVRKQMYQILNTYRL